MEENSIGSSAERLSPASAVSKFGRPKCKRQISDTRLVYAASLRFSAQQHAQAHVTDFDVYQGTFSFTTLAGYTESRVSDFSVVDVPGVNKHPPCCACACHKSRLMHHVAGIGGMRAGHGQIGNMRLSICLNDLHCTLDLHVTISQMNSASLPVVALGTHSCTFACFCMCTHLCACGTY